MHFNTLTTQRMQMLYRKMTFLSDQRSCQERVGNAEVLQIKELLSGTSEQNNALGRKHKMISGMIHSKVSPDFAPLRR
jgi:hypothetical protein